MRKTKRKISKKNVISLFMIILCTLSSIYLLYSISLLKGIETMIRIIVSIIIIIFLIALVFVFLKNLKNKKISKKIITYFIINTIYSIILIIFGYYIIRTYKVVDRFSNDSTIYSSSLVTLEKNKNDSIKGVKGKIGIVSDSDNIIGYQIPNEIIKNEKLDVEKKKYDSYIELINALYNKKIDYAFLPTNYVIMFSGYDGADFSKLENDTKIIYTKEKKVSNKTSSKSSNLTEPFTILLMGVDSENEQIAGSTFNGDSLMLITFNPKTLNLTMLSIPRDTYVPITCFAGKKKNKITHAAWYGEECMISTVENFTGIKIDYYVKINFKGLVKIVDTLGGVDVDVPYSFCEQNSDRKFGNDTIYVKEGFQTLNGEQALAFSRNRHTWPEYCGKEYSNYVSNDFIRGQNQQTVLKAIMNKIKEKGSLDTIYNLLDVVSASMETNMTTNEILSLYNVGKDVISKSSSGQNIDDIIGMQKLYLSGKDAYIYDSDSGLKLYNFILFDESLKQVIKAMKINLDLEEKEIIKEFKYSIDEEYETPVIGKIDYGTTSSYTSKDIQKIEGNKETSEETKEQVTNKIETSMQTNNNEIKNDKNNNEIKNDKNNNTITDKTETKEDEYDKKTEENKEEKEDEKDDVTIDKKDNEEQLEQDNDSKE